MALVFRWTVTGRGSNLDGALAIGPRQTAVGPVDGRLDWSAVAALMPDLPIGCDMTARFDAVALRDAPQSRTGSGTITTAAGQCARIGSSGAPTPSPALNVALASVPDGVEAVVTTQADRNTPLVTARLTDTDRLVMTIHRAGAALVPGMPSAADSQLDLPLSTVLR